MMVMGMTRVNEVAYITVGVGDLKITNTSDGNGELILEWLSVRDFHHAFLILVLLIPRSIL